MYCRKCNFPLIRSHRMSLIQRMRVRCPTLRRGGADQRRRRHLRTGPRAQFGSSPSKRRFWAVQAPRRSVSGPGSPRAPVCCILDALLRFPTGALGFVELHRRKFRPHGGCLRLYLRSGALRGCRVAFFWSNFGSLVSGRPFLASCPPA